MERMGVAPGTEVGGYRVLAPLGQGGMGAVYRAVDGEGVVVALKLLHPHLGADPQARERLTREVANLQRVRHPGVARVLDAEIDSSEAFVVTELLDGQDLAARVRGSGPLDLDALVALAEDLHDALGAVHAAGVLHRDLTPGNVLLGRPRGVGGRGAVLIDFGIAQAAEDARVTSTGLVAGTPGYLSPELLAGADPGPEADWWGWAAVLAFAATGRPPFGARPVAAVLARVRSGEPDLAGLDRRVAATLGGALALDPAERTEPADVLAALRDAADDPDGEWDEDADGAMTEVVPGQPGPTAPWPGLATAVVASDGATRVLPAGGGAPPPPPPASPAWPPGPLAPEPPAAVPPPVPPAIPPRYPESPPPDGDDVDGYAPAGGEPFDDDDDGGGGPSDPPRRAGTLLALGAVAVAAGASWPGAALAGVLVLAVLVRSVGLDVAAVQRRRAERGTGRADVARGVAGWPWYLARAVLGVLPAALVAASAVVLLGGIGWWLVDTGRIRVAAPAPGEPAGDLAGNAEWVPPALLAAAVLLGVLLVWFGPLSRATRLGARWTLAALAPGRTGAVVVVLVALAAAAALVVLVVLGQDVRWWPLPGPPDLR